MRKLIMVSKKATVFFSFFICTASSILFGLKYSVMAIEDRISRAKKELAIEKKNQHILKAEWKTLTSPERIQRLTMKYLSMKQVEPKQLKEFDAAIFYDNSIKKARNTKRLSKIISEVLAQSGEDE